MLNVTKFSGRGELWCFRISLIMKLLAERVLMKA